MWGEQQEERTRFGAGHCATCADEEVMPAGLAPIPVFLRAAAPVFFHKHARWNYHALFAVAFLTILVTAVQSHRATGRERTDLAFSQIASIAQLTAVTLPGKSGYPVGAGVFSVVGG